MEKLLPRKMPARLALAAALLLVFAGRPAHSEPPLPSINLPIEDWTVVAYANGFLQQAYAQIGTTDVRLVDPGTTQLSGSEPIRGTSLRRGIVFQDHRLLPWLTLSENIGLSLANVDWPQQRKRDAVREHIELVGPTGFEQAYPYQLSGGMAQRATIARGLVSEPEILLLDEPLGALDALTRIRLQDELLRIWQARRVTMILVTHDVEEAIYLGDRVLVMQSHPGRITRELALDLPRPRDRASQRFTEIRRQILRDMGAVPALAA